MTAALVGLVTGGGIGWLFGRWQQSALRRHLGLARGQPLPPGWTVVPGTGPRIFVLLALLAALRMGAAPWLPVAARWWATGGLLAGYLFTLIIQLATHLRRRPDPEPDSFANSAKSPPDLPRRT